MKGIRLTGFAPLGVLVLLFGGLCYSNLGAVDMLTWDEGEYASIGRSLIRGEGYQYGGEPNVIRPPVMPLLIGAGVLLFGDESDLAAKALLPLFALFTVALVYCAVWSECGVGPALLAGWGLAVAPEFTTRAVLALSEPTYMAFQAAAIACFFLAFERDKSWFKWGWVCFALALSTRYTALLFGPMLLLILGYEWSRDRDQMLRLLRNRTFWLAPFYTVPILGPWYLREWLVTGNPLHGMQYASGQIDTYGDLFMDVAMPWHFYLTALLSGMTWPLALGGAVGLFYGAWMGKRLAVYALVATLVILGWHTQYEYKETRLVTPALPFLALGVGYCAKAWADWVAGWSWLRPLALPVAALLLATWIGLPQIYRYFIFARTLGEPSFLQAMAHVRGSTDPDTRLLGPNVAQMEWYADRHSRSLPREESALPEMLDGVDWVIITNFERGQPSYLRRVLQQATATDFVGGDVQLFKDDRYVTLLARPDWLLDKTSSSATDER